MGELGLQEWGGFGGENSQVFQVKGVAGNTSGSGHAQEHSARTGWGCEQMQLWFIRGAVGKWSHLRCTVPTMGTTCFIGYRCLTEQFWKTLTPIDFPGSSVDVSKLLMICKYLLYYL